MKTIKKITFVVVLTFGCVRVHAQQIPTYTHYMYNTLVVNPAYAGSRDALTITGLYRSQWVDFKGAPVVQTLTVHAPLRNEHFGVGLSVLNDKTGPTNNSSLVGDFAYRMKLNEKSKLALGISGGVNMFQATLNSLNLDQQTDPTFQNNISNRITPNFGAGAYYSRARFYAGISVPNLLQNNYSSVIKADGTTLVGKEQRSYFLIAGTVINISDNLAFKPTALLKVTAGAPAQLDLTASFIIVKKLLLGVMYRSGDAVGALIGFDITNQLHIGYSYDWSYGLATSKYNQGSHELMLRYDFIYGSNKQIHSPRYF
jgi:type IX secretion system PorP/SprF family membrane protein